MVQQEEVVTQNKNTHAYTQKTGDDKAHLSKVYIKSNY